MEKIYAGTLSEREILKKEFIQLYPTDNPVLAGYVKVWLNDGTTNLLSPAQCKELGVALPGEEIVVEPKEKVEAPVEAPIEAPVETPEEVKEENA